MKKVKFKIKNPQGIHAEPAESLVYQFRKFKSDVIIEKDNKPVDGKNIFELMSLCIKYGDKITIIFQGEDEREALRSAKAIMKGLI